MRRLPRLIATLALATGCATADKDTVDVNVTGDALAVKDCKFLGNIQDDDHSYFGHTNQVVAESRATPYMRNKANALGANTILLLRTVTNIGGAVQLGEAYACPARPATPPAPADLTAESPPKAKE
jgi:hypothetical protein